MPPARSSRSGAHSPSTPTTRKRATAWVSRCFAPAGMSAERGRARPRGVDNPDVRRCALPGRLDAAGAGRFRRVRASRWRSLAISRRHSPRPTTVGLARYALGEPAVPANRWTPPSSCRPDLFAARLERGLHALHDQRFGAAAEFEAVLASAPHHADARYLLGTALAAHGAGDAAMRCFEEAVSHQSGVHRRAQETGAVCITPAGDYVARGATRTRRTGSRPDFADLHKILGDILHASRATPTGRASAYARAACDQSRLRGSACSGSVIGAAKGRAREGGGPGAAPVHGTASADVMARTLSDGGQDSDSGRVKKRKDSRDTSAETSWNGIQEEETSPRTNGPTMYRESFGRRVYVTFLQSVNVTPPR